MADEMERHGSFYDTPFILPKEPGNKFAVVDEVKKTMNEAFEIPFLRTQIDPCELSKTQQSFFRPNISNGFSTAGKTSPKSSRAGSPMKGSPRKRVKGSRSPRKSSPQKIRSILGNKEANWQNYIVPYSSYNSKVHAS